MSCCFLGEDAVERKKVEKNEVLAEIVRTERAIEAEEREVKRLVDKTKALFESFEKSIEPKDEKSARDPKYQKYMRFLAMVRAISLFSLDVTCCYSEIFNS